MNTRCQTEKAPTLSEVLPASPLTVSQASYLHFCPVFWCVALSDPFVTHTPWFEIWLSLRPAKFF